MAWPPIMALMVSALTLAAVGVPLAMARRLGRALRRPPSPPEPAWTPSVAVIVPVKGQSDELAELEPNARAILQQDWPESRVVFALAQADDPALPVLQRLCAETPRRAECLVAPVRSGCGQKISNQLAALDHLAGHGQVLAFMDADARPDPALLRRLVEPLADPHVGVSTAYRWYNPRRGVGSWLRAAWNAGGLPIMLNARHNYAWGGAMALRRDVFDACAVADHWRRALSDDLGLSALVKAAGHRVHWVPGALVECSGAMTLAQCLEWTNRQTVICRVYNPRMWRDLLAGELLTLATGCAALALALAGAWGGGWAVGLTGLACLVALIGGRLWYQWTAVDAARRSDPRLVPPGAALRLVLGSLPAHVLILINSLHAAVVRTIAWRGIRYRLNGPWDIEVLAPPDARAPAPTPPPSRVARQT